MLNPVSLIKANPLLPAEDYTAMRAQGIQLIEQLGSDIWTEYNNSDPGITILEAVCYAITDLSYRTDFDIKDLLAPKELTNDTWNQIFYTAKQILHNTALTMNDYRKLLIDIEGVRNAWLMPSKDYEVPVWIDYNFFEKRIDADCDCEEKEEKICYGKLGINAVPLETAKANRQAQAAQILQQIQAITPKLIEAQKEFSQLPTDADVAVIERLKATIADLEDQIEILKQEQRDASSPAFQDPEIVEMEGLYTVMVEYEENVIDDGQREDVRQVVIDRLTANRNLCEDFLSIEAVEYLDFGIGASIVLEEYADPDKILAQIFFTIYKFFTPSIPFNTIQQMLDKGFQVDEIFEGPALEHGFIDDADLEKTALFRNITLSSIISEICNISGVKAITYLHLPFSGVTDKQAVRNYFRAWVDFLQDARKIARIQPAMSQIIFCKQREFITYYTGGKNDRAPDKMLKLFKDMKTVERKYKLIGAEDDFPVPTGENMELQDYYPVTYSLPMTYGVSDRAGLPANSDDARKTQALQLGGYLLFFEQILADYLVQLDHLTDLFSFDSNIKQTQFSRALTEIENLQDLLIDKGGYGPTHFDQILADFTAVVEGLIETADGFNSRRNGFLDHMLARFSEDMTEYGELMKWLSPSDVATRLITDKIGLLKDKEYEYISNGRGKAYNYADPDNWGSGNVSGAERRISRLLGFANTQSRSLLPQFLVCVPSMEDPDLTSATPPKQKVSASGVPLNKIEILDSEDNTKVIFTSVDVMQGCCTEQLMEDILEHADDPIYFKFSDEIKARSRRAAGLLGKFYFELYDSTDPAVAVLLGSSDSFDKKEDRDSAFAKLQQIMVDVNNNEGLHLVEHILLRPKLDEVLDENNNEETVSLLNICLDSCDLSNVLDEDVQLPPYKKKISRLPADKCYDTMPWVLQYMRLTPETGVYDKSILFKKCPTDDTSPTLMKFRTYEDMVQRINDLAEYGSERVNYEIISDGQQPARYGFIIHGDEGVVLAQSIYIFSKSSDNPNGTPGPLDVEQEIESLMQYFGYQLDLYCEPAPCDANADPYSFRTTIVLPCWPKRLRNPTFRNLVEKTIVAESPAHVQSRVVWIGIQEMQRFEKAYKAWLLEMSQTEVPDYSIVNPLVDTINTLVPCGVCDDDCNHESSSSPQTREGNR